MTARVPTFNECALAAERMDLRSKRTRKGTPTFLGLQFQVFRPRSRDVAGKCKRRYSTGRINGARAGALLIAADDDRQQVNPALLHASALLHERYVYVVGGESFSEVVSYCALQLLRAGWRHDDDEVACECAELAARRTRSAWWSE
jgi:hypothetical protein